MITRHPRWRMIATAFGLLGALVFLLYPFDRHPIYSPVESISAIPCLPILYISMLAWVIADLYALRTTDSDMEAIAILTGLAIVYLGFWTVHAPNGRFEDWSNMAGAEELMSLGRLRQSGHYWPWPGLGLIGGVLGIITGRHLPQLLAWVVVVIEAAVPTLIYAIVRNIFLDPEVARLTTMVVILANPFLPRFHFYPANFGTILLLAGLLCVMRRRFCSLTIPLIATGLTVTHFVSNVVLLFIIAGALVVERARAGGESMGRIFLAALAWAVIVTVAWHVYWAVPLIRLVGMQAIVRGRLLLGGHWTMMWGYVARLFMINAEPGATPWWLVMVRMFWLVWVYIAGIGVAVVWLVASRNRWTEHAHVTLLSMCLLSLVGISVLAGYLSTGGGELYRYIQLGSIFASPLCVFAILKLRMGEIPGTAIVWGVVASLFVPTFLGGGDRSLSYSYYGAQVMAGRWVHGVVENSAEMPVGFGVNPGWSLLAYYSRDELVERPPELDEVNLGNLREAMRARYDDYARRYIAVGDSREAILWLDGLGYAYFSHWFGPGGATYILAPIERAVAATDLVYSNGLVLLAHRGHGSAFGGRL